MAKNRVIFLDRDYTIVQKSGYTKDTSEIAIYPENHKALSILQKHFLLIIISNQSGISNGLTSEDEVKKTRKHFIDSLKAINIIIHDIFYCLHRNEDYCLCKKPSPYFINKATDLYNISLTDSFIIGDHPTDAKCGLNAGVKPIHVLTGRGYTHKDELPSDIKTCMNLLEAAKYIINFKNDNISDRYY